MSTYKWENAFSDMKKNVKKDIIAYIHDELVNKGKISYTHPNDHYIDDNMIKEILDETKGYVVYKDGMFQLKDVYNIENDCNDGFHEKLKAIW